MNRTVDIGRSSTSPTPSGATPAAMGAGLTAEQIRQYRERGYILLPPGFVDVDVVVAANASLEEVLVHRGPECVFETDGDTVRSVYGTHRLSLAMWRLSADPDLQGAVDTLLQGRSYVHQSKVNVKAAFAGEQWGWHQDFVYWLTQDDLPAPHLVNAALFVDDVAPYNGPLTFIPGSHRYGVLSGDWNGQVDDSYEHSPGWVSTLTSTEKFEVAPETITEMAQRHGLDAPTGPAGSILLFHPNLLHCSPPNMSPFRRLLTMFVYNRVDNRGTEASTRPWFLAEPTADGRWPPPPTAQAP